MKPSPQTLLFLGLLSAATAGAQTVIQNVTYSSGTTTVFDPISITASTNVTVQNGATVNYVAGSGVPGNGIHLEPGFHAATGSTFSALILPAPPSFQATDAEPSYVTLSWGASQAADHYDIYRNGVKIASVSASGSLSYTDNGAPSGAMYAYTIYAVTSGGLTSLASVITVSNPLLEVFAPPP